MITFTALSGMVSLAADYGRVRLAKAELQNAADAAARYGVQGLGDGTAVTKAKSAASQNTVDGTATAVLDSDVETGNWNSVTGAYTPGVAPLNAVRVTAVRSAARGTGVQTLFAKLIGFDACDVSATSIAVHGGANEYNVVGLSGITLTGSGKVRRSPLETGTVNVGSNGTWSLGWGQQIDGDVYYRGAGITVPNGSNCITGDRIQLVNALAYPTATLPGGTIPLGAISYSGATVTSVAGGNYSATSLTMSGGATVTLTGDVNFYCNGPIDVSNVVVNTAGTTYKLTIYATSSSAVTINTPALYARIYAPASTVNINGTTAFTGSILANQLNVSGTVSYHSALRLPLGHTSGGAVSFVK